MADDCWYLQDILETYVHTTESLRHFYSILNRTGDFAPANGNASALKAAEIVRQLSVKTSAALTAKKRKMTEIIAMNESAVTAAAGRMSAKLRGHAAASQTQQCEASLGLVNGILTVVQRAVSTWETHCGGGDDNGIVT